MTKQKIDLKPYTRPLVALAIPILVENVLRTFMGSVNVFFLSAWSDEAVAAVGVANQYLSMFNLLLSLVSGGAAVVISQSIGSGEQTHIRQSSMVSLFIAAIMGVLAVAVSLIFAPFLVSFMDIAPSVARDAVLYFRIAGSALFAQGMIAALSALCRSHARASLPMIAIITMNVLNAAGTALAVFHPISPALSGVAGTAWSYVFSGTLAFILLAALVVRQRFGFGIKDLRPFPWAMLKEVVRIGSAPGLEALSYHAVQITVMGIVSGLGVVALSARTYLLSVVGYVFLLGMSIGQATQLLIARFAGAGELDMADALVRRNSYWIFFGNLAISLGLLSCWRFVFGALTDDPAVLALIFPALCADVLVESGRGIGSCYNNAVRAVGDIRVMIIVMLISLWVICLPLSFGLSRVWGLAGIWVASGVDEVVRGTAACIRWNTGRWKKRFQDKAAA